MRVAWLLVLLLPCFAMDCNRYMCTPSTVSLASDICIIYNSTLPQGPAWLLQECTDPLFSYCPPIIDESNSTCEVPPRPDVIPSSTEMSAPGEPCVFDYDCYGETICEDGKCWNPGNSCTTDESCNPGSYCNATSYSCQPQSGPGGPCEYDTMCENAYGCNFNICTKYMSLQFMDKISDCYNNYTLLCQSQMCFEDNQGDYFCAWNVTSFNTSTPVQCEFDEDCLSNIVDTYNFTGICSCTYGTTGIAYCSVFPGDFPSNMLLASMGKWFNGTEINGCNTARRTSPSCIAAYMSEEDSVTYFYYYYYTVNFPAIQDMDQCAETIYVQSYFTALEAYNNYFSKNKTEPSWAGSLSLAGVVLTAVVGI